MYVFGCVDDFRHNNQQLLVLDSHYGAHVHNRALELVQIHNVENFAGIQNDDDEEPNCAPIQAYIRLTNK